MDRYVPSPHSGPVFDPGSLPPLASSRFFPGPLAEGTAAALDRYAPGARARVLAAAETLLDGRFDLLGYRGLTFGDPLEWHLDPVSGRRAPLHHWTLLDPLDGDVIGDSKVIWELSRHQWLVRLGQAYRLTGDQRFARAFDRQVTAWIEANPQGLGINWASSLEVALRLISWCWALHLFQGSSALTPALQARVLGGLSAHATHVERYLSRYFSPNTHLTGEALGLFYAGSLFPSLPSAGRWQRRGQRILEEESARQIGPDGVYFEQSTCYQRYTAEIYLHYLILAERSGCAASPDVRERVAKLLDALIALIRPDHSLPAIGDADGGWLLPLDLRGPDDTRAIFSTAAVLFDRPDYAWAAGELEAETLWLLGSTAAERFDALRPIPPSGAASRALPTGGYAILRTGWQEDADQVILDAGPLGCPYSGGHGHADLLAVQCSFRGKPYVVDPGTFRYTTDQGWRSYFRSTAAHSTVMVDGIGQAVPRGPFAWQTRPRARLLRWECGEALDFAQAEHDAYRQLVSPVVHRRTAILVKSGYCVLVDDLEGGGEHRLDLRLQLAPLPVTVGPDGWVRVVPTDGCGLLVHAFSTAPFKVTVAEGELEPRQGWVSSGYGLKEPAPALVWSAVTALPIRVMTILLPALNVDDPPSICPVVQDGILRGLLIESDGQILQADPPALVR